jgi:sialic acid synthase SpsE
MKEILYSGTFFIEQDIQPTAELSANHNGSLKTAVETTEQQNVVPIA